MGGQRWGGGARPGCGPALTVAWLQGRLPCGQDARPGLRGDQPEGPLPLTPVRPPCVLGHKAVSPWGVDKFLLFPVYSNSPVHSTLLACAAAESHGAGGATPGDPRPCSVSMGPVGSWTPTLQCEHGACGVLGPRWVVGRSKRAPSTTAGP